MVEVSVVAFVVKFVEVSIEVFLVTMVVASIEVFVRGRKWKVVVVNLTRKVVEVGNISVVFLADYFQWWD